MDKAAAGRATGLAVLVAALIVAIGIANWIVVHYFGIGGLIGLFAMWIAGMTWFAGYCYHKGAD